MSLLDNWLQRNAVIAHRARSHALVRVVGALLSGGKLALTHLGRHRAGGAFVKHHIKAVDRLPPSGLTRGDLLTQVPTSCGSSHPLFATCARIYTADNTRGMLESDLRSRAMGNSSCSRFIAAAVGVCSSSRSARSVVTTASRGSPISSEALLLAYLRPPFSSSECTIRCHASAFSFVIPHVALRPAPAHRPGLAITGT